MFSFVLREGKNMLTSKVVIIQFRYLIFRMMDFVEKGKVSFENLKYLVLDEADRWASFNYL